MLYEFLIAISLIIAPEQTDEENKKYVFLRPYIQIAAVKMELLDEREMRYILNDSRGLPNNTDFSSDLNFIRRRYEELHDAPSVHESVRIIPREYINDFLSFNRTYKQYLESAQMLEKRHNWDEYDRMIKETELLYQIWDIARDAKCEYYYVTVRRQALKRLRTKLGNEMFYSGQMPPCVPIWNFESNDRQK